MLPQKKIEKKTDTKKEEYSAPIPADWNKCSTLNCGGIPCISRPTYRKGAPICVICAAQECLSNPVKQEFVSV